jgi:hypothetical protein
MKAWTVLFVLLLLVGCTVDDIAESRPDENNTPVPSVEAMTPQSDATEIETDMNTTMSVKIDSQADVQDEMLSISYRVHNGLTQPIYLVNRVFKWSKTGFSVDPSIVYTQLSDGELWLTKANLEVPEDFDVEAPDVPFLTKVEAGESFVESFSLPLPLEPYHAYGEVPRVDEASTFNQLKLVIGWLPGEEVTTRTSTRPDGLTLTSAGYLEVEVVQRLLFSDLQVSIPAYIQTPQ